MNHPTWRTASKLMATLFGVSVEDADDMRVPADPTEKRARVFKFGQCFYTARFPYTSNSKYSYRPLPRGYDWRPKATLHGIEIYEATKGPANVRP